jgi:drug/metabolite transporter (DMT)-like permease
MPVKTALAFVGAFVIGGSNFVAVRYSNEELAPYWGAGVRFALATLLLLAVTRVMRLPLPSGRALVATALYGALSIGVSYALLYWALVSAPAVFASVVVALVPLLTLLLAAAEGLERLSWRGLAGGAVAISGVAVVFGEQLRLDVPLAAGLAALAGAVCIAQANVLAKRLPHLHIFSVNTIAFGVGAALLLALSLLAGEPRALPQRSDTWIALAYLVVPGAIGLFGLFLYVLERLTASATSYVLVLAPIVTVTLGVLLRAEPVTGTLLAGAVLVGIGVYLGALTRGRRTEATPSPAPRAAR